MSLHLTIGNKAYSSWSLRPWLLLRVLDIPFEEEVVPLYVEGTREKLLALAPTGKVPLLRDGDFTLWDSLAITEYLAETFPEKGVWPQDRQARARARSLCAEMHSSFQALRQQCPTNFRRKNRETPREIDAAALADVARIEQAFADARAQFGAGGPFLFGAFSAADAFFAPIISRLTVYRAPVSAATTAYCQLMLDLPAFAQWRREAQAESWVIEKWEGL